MDNTSFIKESIKLLNTIKTAFCSDVLKQKKLYTNSFVKCKRRYEKEATMETNTTANIKFLLWKEVCLKIAPHTKDKINLKIKVNGAETKKTGLNKSNKHDPIPAAIPPATGPNIKPEIKQKTWPKWIIVYPPGIGITNLNDVETKISDANNPTKILLRKTLSIF